MSTMGKYTIETKARLIWAVEEPVAGRTLGVREHLVKAAIMALIQVLLIRKRVTTLIA